jgi:hypothetical protein
MSKIFQEARDLKALGYDVIPVGAVDPASGAFNPKNPGIVKDWRSYAWDAEAIVACLAEDERRGIGLRLSPSTYIDIESDTKEADDAATELFKGLKTPSWWGAGANGHYAGKHRLFRLTSDQQNWLIENQREGGFKTGAGIEVRCTGQSVVPPSGGRKWDYGPSWEFAELSDAVWAELTRGQERKKREVAEAQADTPGADFCIRGDWREILEPHGWTFADAAHVIRPGKTEGITGTVGVCTSPARGDLLFIFSDAPEIAPFETRISYSKFEAYTMLNHGGNFSAAARALRKEGYGYSKTAETMFEEHEIEWDAGPEVVEDDLLQEWPDAMERGRVVHEMIEASLVGDPNSYEPSAFLAAEDGFKCGNEYATLDECYYDNPIGRYMQELRNYSNIDYQAAYFQALEIFGALVGRNGWYEYNMETRFLTDYLIVVGLTGAGKGTTFDAAKRLFKSKDNDPFSDAPAHQRAYNAINQGRFGSGEGLLVSLAERTPERDVHGLTLGEQYKHVLFISDQEASAAFAKMAIDNSVVNENLRQTWDFNSLSNQTKAKSLVARNPLVGFVWHIVPDDLNRLPANLLHGGFINRLKIVACRKPIKSPRIRHGMDLEKHKLAVGAVLELVMSESKQITFSRGAEAKLDTIQEWQHNLEGVVATTHERFTAHVERMACRLALLRGGRHEVQADDVEAAEAMQRVVYEHTEHLIGPLRSGDMEELFVQRLLEFIRDAAGPVKLSEITRNVCNNNVALISKRDAALDKLVGQKLIARGNVKQEKGRPITIYQASSSK